MINCSPLEHLCIQSPTNVVSEEELDSAYEQQFNHQCQTLEVLLLHNTQVAASGAAFVPRFTPNLTLLGNFVSPAPGLKRLYELTNKP
jgi:hypothetical protein